MGVQFEAELSFAKELRFRKHTNGELATIHFHWIATGHVTF